MKLHAFIIGGAIAAALFGLYALAAAMFLLGVATLPMAFEPTGCNQNCHQGRDCRCGKPEASAEDFA